MQILSAKQIRKIDQLTIEREPISSLDLMERAGTQLVNALLTDTRYKRSEAVLFCGHGNNGGDALVMARQLSGYDIAVQVIITKAENRSLDNQSNLDRLKEEAPQVGIHWFTDFDYAHVSSEALCIDALLGTGVNRPVTGELATAISTVNSLPNRVISIDVPSGLHIDGPSFGPIIKADLVLTLQTPKLAFLMSDSDPYIGDFSIVDIGLDQEALNAEPTQSFLLTEHMLYPLLLSREKFSHKGNYGHALLVCGSYGKAGAAVLAAKAALRSGLALLTCHLPTQLVAILQTAVPEAMVQADPDPKVFSSIVGIAPYSTLGIGCGLGTDAKSAEGLAILLKMCRSPIVLDADSLNILSENPQLWKDVPKNSILTPHPGEFRRLAGSSTSSWDEWNVQKQLAKKHHVLIILKGAHTKITLPSGVTYFNNTGNPGMASAGSGDVLTGILTGLLARGYPPADAACLGVYVHGLCGDRAEDELGMESMVASDLIRHLPAALKSLYRVQGRMPS